MVVDRPEVQLLVCCARSRKDQDVAARIEALLQQNLGWTYLLQMARRHALVPLLYWHLSDAQPGSVPEAYLSEMRTFFLANNQRNLLLTRELLKVVKEFESEGVPIIPYKGPVLAASAYGNLALRRFVDLDVLVHKYDIPRAKRVLSSLGYVQQDDLTEGQEAAFLHSDCEYHFAPNGEDENLVELHWRITPRTFSFLLDPESLWERLEKAPMGGATVPSLSAEDLLLILCAHGCAEFWHQLRLICDVAELVQAREALDWEALVNRAGAVGSRRMLFLGLFLANDLLDAPLPPGILRMVRQDGAVEGLARQVYGWLFQSRNLPRGFSERGEDNTFSRFHLAIRERFKDKIRYCARVTMTPNPADWTVLSLPTSLWPLYYVLRPLRLTGRYAHQIVPRRR